MTDTRQMVRTANPVPTGAELLNEGELDALLHLTMQRSTDMDLKERPRLDTPQPRRKNGWPIALAAFAIVIILGVVLFNGSGDDSVGPVDQPTTTVTPTTTQGPDTTTSTQASASATTTVAPATTTTEAPQVDPDDLAAIEAFVATFNSGDSAATLESLTPDALVWSDIVAGGSTQEPLAYDEFGDVITRLFRYWSVQQTLMTVRDDSCEPRGELINCRGTFSDIIVDQSPFGEAGLSVTFGVEPDGRVSYLFVNENQPSMQAAYGSFFAWLDENHPGDFTVLLGGRQMSLRDDALELLPIRTAEWIASLDQ